MRRSTHAARLNPGRDSESGRIQSVLIVAPKRILIADDQPFGREFLRTVLESSGYEVSEAADGAEALEKALSTSPDLVLLDIHMPSRDGLSVVKELRNDPRFAFTPIIAVTATAMKGDQEKGLEAGFTEYLTKPVSIVTLRQTVARFLNQTEEDGIFAG
jgi:CheY-like chemotaxis protein